MAYEPLAPGPGPASIASRDPPVPAELGLSVDESETCVGFDVRGDVFVSADRRWGFGAALAFVDVDPSFVDVETGDTGSLQVSGFFLKLGVRRAW